MIKILSGNFVIVSQLIFFYKMYNTQSGTFLTNLCIILKTQAFSRLEEIQKVTVYF
jgi:hypothetical protein